MTFHDNMVDSTHTNQDNPNDLIVELAALLNITEIDNATLQVCIKLIDQGIDPQQLANYILKINNETRSAIL